MAAWFGGQCELPNALNSTVSAKDICTHVHNLDQLGSILYVCVYIYIYIYISHTHKFDEYVEFYTGLFDRRIYKMLPVSSLHQDLETQVRTALLWVRQGHLPCAWHGPSKGTHWIFLDHVGSCWIILSYWCLEIPINAKILNHTNHTQRFYDIHFHWCSIYFSLRCSDRNLMKSCGLCLLWFRW